MRPARLKATQVTKADLAEYGSASADVAVVFRTHYLDAEVARRLCKLRNDVERHCAGTDVHLLVEAETQVPPDFEAIATRFSYGDYAARFPKASREGVYPGNHHLPALYFAESHPQYSHYWFIEYDVVYAGDWCGFLDEFRAEPADLLTTHLRELRDDPHWPLAKTLDCAGEDRTNLTGMAAFLPIYRASRPALDAVHDACARGWSGHWEALVPTAILAAGLTLSDLGGNGKWTPPHRRNRHYLSPDRVSLWDHIGTFRFRPEIVGPLLPGMLHHPCKSGSENDLYAYWRAYQRAFRAAPLDMSRLVLRSLSRFLQLPRR
jgi:hypothetical protein